MEFVCYSTFPMLKSLYISPFLSIVKTRTILCFNRILPNWSEWMKQRNQLEVEMVMLKAMMTVAMPTRTIHTHRLNTLSIPLYNLAFPFWIFFSHSFPPLHSLASLALFVFRWKLNLVGQKHLANSYNDKSQSLKTTERKKTPYCIRIQSEYFPEKWSIHENDWM